MIVILETDRLLVRDYMEEDAEAFFKLNTDPEVLRFVPDKMAITLGSLFVAALAIYFRK